MHDREFTVGPSFASMDITEARSPCRLVGDIWHREVLHCVWLLLRWSLFAWLLTEARILAGCRLTHYVGAPRSGWRGAHGDAAGVDGLWLLEHKVLPS